MLRMSRLGSIVIVASVVALGPTRAAAWVAVGLGPRIVGGAAVGVAAGAVAGAAVASAARPSTVVVESPPPAATTAPPPAAPPPAAAGGPPAAVGSVVTTLPSGCSQVEGRYRCGSAWYQPYFGGNGVYYQVVAP